MKNWVKKIQEFFSRPKVIKWTIAILTLLIVVGAIKVLVWTIYTKDQPDFVPEKVREDIQGAIKESGEAIKKVSKPIGTTIVDSAYQGPETEKEDPTAGWPIYKDLNTGISMKYPVGWEVFQGEEGVFSFAPDEDSLDGVFVYQYKIDSEIITEWWAKHVSDWDATFKAPQSIILGGREVLLFEQIDGMQGRYYLIKIADRAYAIVANGEGHEYIEKILISIN